MRIGTPHHARLKAKCVSVKIRLIPIYRAYMQKMQMQIQMHPRESVNPDPKTPAPLGREEEQRGPKHFGTQSRVPAGAKCLCKTVAVSVDVSCP